MSISLYSPQIQLQLLDCQLTASVIPIGMMMPIFMITVTTMPLANPLIFPAPQTPTNHQPMALLIWMALPSPMTLPTFVWSIRSMVSWLCKDWCDRELWRVSLLPPKPQFPLLPCDWLMCIDCVLWLFTSTELWLLLQRSTWSQLDLCLSLLRCAWSLSLLTDWSRWLPEHSKWWLLEIRWWS